MPIAVTRKAHFNAAHRLCNPNWDEQKNSEVFGLAVYLITMGIIMNLMLR
jgi:hypothetical protein